MAHDKPSTLVPKLRFSEFKGAPDWKEATLGTLLEQPPDYGVNAAAVPLSENLPTYIRITDINDDGLFEFRTRVSVNIDATDKRYLESGDIVLARTGASVGKSYRYREEDGRLVHAGFLIRVRPNPDRLQSQYLAGYLMTRRYWDWVRLTSARSGQPGINAAEYASIPLPLPPDGDNLAEQQKIADCLGSLDDLIAAEDRKLEALRQHKQGLMQQLFPQPGETVPRLRFPEFGNVGSWDEIPLGKLGYFIGGGTPRKDHKAFWSGNIPWITSSDVSEESIQQISVSRYISQEAVDKSATKIVPNGSILLVSRVGVGKLAISRHEMCTSQDFTNFVPREVNATFLAYCIKSRKQALKRYCQGSTITGFTSEDISSMKMPVPQSNEQKKIADCLGSLDDLIAAKGQKLEALRQHKQGLMQQLFPSLD